MKRWSVLLAVILAAMASCAWAQQPAAGPNVNMVSGKDWTTGDPFLQRQNEPSIAISTRNTNHLLAGANDYRSVDFEELFGDVNSEQTPDAWLGVFKSLDGGATWASTLLPGFPADSTRGAAAGGPNSPIFGLQAAADPIVRAGTNGMFYYAGIGFNRTNNLGKVFVARFIDNNNKENGDPANLQTPGLFTAVSPTDPIRYLGTTVVQSGTATQFLDKPWLAVDVPRGTATCKISYTNPDGTTGVQTIPASNIYLTFSDFVNQNSQSMILFTRSKDCGATWSAPIALSPVAVNQGSTIAVAPPIPGTEKLLPPLVYVAWRRFGSGNVPSAIMMAESLDGGASFTPAFAAHTFPLSCNATPTGTGCPFDQGITSTSFRTNTYPALTADTTGRMYLAWSQRQANGDARIMMQVGLVGIPLPPPAVVDNGPVLDDYGNPLNLSGRGHQLMPSLTFNAGKLMLIYYDLRQDHTIGQYTPLANLLGYGETRLFEGELNASDPADSSVFNFWVQDAAPPLSVRRHTIDVQGAQATPRAPLSLTPPAFNTFRVAHYQFGINPYDNPSFAEQLEVNPPNLPMFQQGHAPFMGDYIDVAGAPTFVLKSGKWHFNTDGTAGLPVFQAVWTDNRNVRPPLNGDWTQYSPPYSASNPGGASSKFDPSQNVLACNPNFVASRNQDVYTSRIAPGLVVAMPGNQKTLGNAPGTSTPLQRAFSLVVQNTTTLLKSFRLTIANQPLLANGSVDPFGQATFQQLPLPSPTLTVLDVQVNPLSSIARQVFVTSQNPTASVTVNVQEITAPFGTVVSGGLTGTAVINPDPTTPPIINPDNPSVGNPSVGNAEVYNPSVGNPSVGNPSVGNAALLNPSVGNPSVGNPSVGNPSVGNQAFATALNPSIGNPSVGNPSVGNPSIGNPSVGNQSVTDASYGLTNTGNTTATYTVKLFGPTLPTNLFYQLILNKIYYLNEPGGVDGCTLQQQPTNVILSNIPNPPIVTDPTNLGDPSVGNPSVGNATVAVPPGETIQITLRISPGNNLPPLTPDQVQHQVLNNVTPVVVSHAVNTQDLGQPIPQPPISLTIVTKTLPNASTTAEVPYSQQLMAIGGVINPPETNYTWSLISDGGLPAGLGLSTSGVISGTPTVGGIFSFTVQVADSAGHTAQQALSILVIAPLVFTPPATLSATVNLPFSEDLSSFTSGGVPPFTFSVAGSTGPFSLTGSMISGTPTAAGTVGPITVKVTDAANQSQSSLQTINIINPVTITNVVPSTAADGFGQLITIFTTGVPDPAFATVTFSQGDISSPGFVFQGPSLANVLFVRLPTAPATALSPGAANVVVTNTLTEVSSPAFGITVNMTPGTPVLNSIYGLATPPAAANNFCGAGMTPSPITDVSGGQGIALSAYGIDTVNSTVVFTQGDVSIPVPAQCALSGPFGVAVPVVVPAGFSVGTISVAIQTRVGDFTSAVSNPISLNLQRTLTSLAVTPGSTLTLGQTQQFTATGTYSDDTSADLTNLVTWNSSDTVRLPIDPTGLTQAYNEDDPLGTGAPVTITASLGLVSSSSLWHVTLLPSVGGVLQPYSCSLEGHVKSLSGSNGPVPASTQTSINFVNNSGQPRKVIWLDYNGVRVLYARLSADQSFVQGTYLTHPWIIATDNGLNDTSGTCLSIYINPDLTQNTVGITQ